MRRIWFLLPLLLLALLPAQAQSKSAPPPLKLKVGATAPDFTLKYFDGAKLSDISLHDFRGKKKVVVAFFVFAFTGG